MAERLGHLSHAAFSRPRPRRAPSQGFGPARDRCALANSAVRSLEHPAVQYCSDSWQSAASSEHYQVAATADSGQVPVCFVVQVPPTD